MVHAGGQAAHWDIQNKENSNLSRFVLDVPVGSLPSSMYHVTASCKRPITFINSVDNTKHSFIYQSDCELEISIQQLDSKQEVSPLNFLQALLENSSRDVMVFIRGETVSEYCPSSKMPG